MTGDGFDDYIIVYDGSAAEVWINQHNVLNADRNFQKLDKKFAGGVSGVTGSMVKFADLNGETSTYRMHTI